MVTKARKFIRRNSSSTGQDHMTGKTALKSENPSSEWSTPSPPKPENLPTAPPLSKLIIFFNFNFYFTSTECALLRFTSVTKKN
jgi:hypothetical protein